jgi:hypothetical protein
MTVPPVDELLPLTADGEQPQNVVEDLKQTQLWCRTAAGAGKMRQDKLLKRSETQLETVSNLGGRTKPLSHRDPDHPAFPVLRRSAARTNGRQTPQV